MIRKYVDKNSKIHTELIEVKPASQTIKERVGKSKLNQIQYAKNQFKWRAAYEWCARQNIKFRILTENDLFHNGRVG